MDLDYELGLGQKQHHEIKRLTEKKTCNWLNKAYFKAENSKLNATLFYTI